jgi:hypothetical protein
MIATIKFVRNWMIIAATVIGAAILCVDLFFNKLGDAVVIIGFLCLLLGPVIRSFEFFMKKSRGPN